MRKGRDGGKKKKAGEKGEKKEKTDENSGHYVIASSRPPKRRPLERRTLAPISALKSVFGWIGDVFMIYLEFCEKIMSFF